MRQISVFSSGGVGAPITLEHEPDRQIKRALKKADKFFKSNGLWPPEERHLAEGGSWLFDLQTAVELSKELERLRSLL